MSCLLLDLVLLLFLLASNGAMAINYAKPTKQVSMLKLAKIQRYLDKINKPPVKSIESPDGDIIDCVLRHRQPALDHPLLKKHKIQTVAPPRPRLKEELQGGEKYTTAAEEVRSAGAWQTWQYHAPGGQCPEGTVPIRRTTVDDVLRAKSLYHFGKKQPRMSTAANTTTTTTTATRYSDAPQGVNLDEHEHAIVSAENQAQMYGAKATINVWDPTIGDDNEFSLAQIWVVSGSYEQSDLNTVEAGWQVYPGIYGDKNPRFFVYWTRNAYNGTGCYNHLCAGFVQTSNSIAVGGSISPVSSYSGTQIEKTILIWKDQKTGNWWISYDGENVGYWPSELFTQLAEHGATKVQWGGEVLNKGGGQGRGHTRTQMGSGHFPEEGLGRASYFRNLQVVDGGNALRGVQSVGTLAEKPNCYNVKSGSSSNWGTYFFFGGPGSNPNCP